VHRALDEYESLSQPYLERIPVRRRDQIVILPVGQIASVVAEGELLYLTTVKNERHTITYRLKDLEKRLNPAEFLRLGRGVLVRIDCITRMNVMPGGTHVALLSNGQKLPVSRLQSRTIREKLLRL
jgi:two-component system LytT family response regulator